MTFIGFTHVLGATMNRCQLLLLFLTLLDMFLTHVDGGAGLLLSMLSRSIGLCQAYCRGAFGSWEIIECRKVFNFS